MANNGHFYYGFSKPNIILANKLHCITKVRETMHTMYMKIHVSSMLATGTNKHTTNKQPQWLH